MHDSLQKRRPVFTFLSLVIAVVFALGSRPILTYSIHQQLADTIDNSEGAMEDASRMSVFALIAGQVICGGMGAAVGVVLAGSGFWRRECWAVVRFLAQPRRCGFCWIPLLSTMALALIFTL